MLPGFAGSIGSIPEDVGARSPHTQPHRVVGWVQGAVAVEARAVVFVADAAVLARWAAAAAAAALKAGGWAAAKVAKGDLEVWAGARAVEAGAVHQLLQRRRAH